MRESLGLRDSNRFEEREREIERKVEYSQCQRVQKAEREVREREREIVSELEVSREFVSFQFEYQDPT